MRQRITTGAWQAGTRLPILSELSREFGVAIVTVRQALSILENEGLVWRRQGKGSFVAELANERHWIKLGTDWSGLIRVWAATEPQILSAETDVALPVMAGEVGIAAPSYRYLRRLHLSRDLPYALLEIYLDGEIWRQAPERFDSQMIIPILQAQPDVIIAEARQTLTISTADLQTAELLQVVETACCFYGVCNVCYSRTPIKETEAEALAACQLRPELRYAGEAIKIMRSIVATRCYIDGWPETIDGIKALLKKLEDKT